jgi:hypothetical protein
MKKPVLSRSKWSRAGAAAVAAVALSFGLLASSPAEAGGHDSFGFFFGFPARSCVSGLSGLSGISGIPGAGYYPAPPYYGGGYYRESYYPRYNYYPRGGGFYYSHGGHSHGHGHHGYNCHH